MIVKRFGALLNQDRLVPIRLPRFNPLRIGRQSNDDGESNDSLHAQVSAGSCLAPRNPRSA